MDRFGEFGVPTHAVAVTSDVDNVAPVEQAAGQHGGNGEPGTGLYQVRSRAQDLVVHQSKITSSSCPLFRGRYAVAISSTSVEDVTRTLAPHRNLGPPFNLNSKDFMCDS